MVARGLQHRNCNYLILFRLIYVPVLMLHQMVLPGVLPLMLVTQETGLLPGTHGYSLGALLRLQHLSIHLKWITRTQPKNMMYYLQFPQAMGATIPCTEMRLSARFLPRLFKRNVLQGFKSTLTLPIPIKVFGILTSRMVYLRQHAKHVQFLPLFCHTLKVELTPGG